MTLLWIDAGAGAAGDMLLGALLDAGAPLDAVQAAVDAVAVEPIRISTDTVTRAGLRALRARVDVADDAAHRTWRDVRTLLAGATLAEPVREAALRTFTLLAEAEGSVHGIDPEEVHFHEVGALDAIADVLGVCAALHALGVTEVACSTVAVGSGTVSTAHGVMIVPVPAVVALLSAAGAPTTAGIVAHEACTPTAAALLAAHVTRWGGQPPMAVRNAGTGAGGRDSTGIANVTRVLVGEDVGGAEPYDHWPGTAGAVVLETNVDDLDPRLWPAVLQRLLDAGASDAWLTPILMKKGRPAHTLQVLATPDRLEVLRRIVFRETSAIGLRERTVRKVALDRSWLAVDVDGRTVRVKVARLSDEVVNMQPEHDDVVAAAAALDRPAKQVLAEASAAALEQLRARVR